MLHLHHSNHLEALFDHLATLLAVPLPDVLDDEVVVVQNPGIARWLSQSLAVRHGIAANLRFPLPASFIWDVFQSQSETALSARAYAKPVLLWRLLALLESQAEQAGFEAVQHYLSHDEQGLKHLQLARRVADLFDQYQVYRPELIQQWEQGEASDWQALLWRLLRESAGAGHRVDHVQHFLDQAELGDLSASTLPERISVFGVSSLAPVYMRVIHALASVTEVHVFLLNPSLSYWGDLVSEANQARLRDLWRAHGKEDVSDLMDTGHPLLASMGTQARDFIDLINEYPAQEFDAWVETPADSLLHQLQQDILLLEHRNGVDQAPVMVEAGDQSVQIHACHSRLREVQVLYDRMLDALQANPELQVRDIAVMAPDIESYAPLIQAVFGAAPEHRRIPFSISDQNAATQSPLLRTVSDWLNLPGKRLTAPEVLSWLEVPAVARRFGISAEAFPKLMRWVKSAGIRWGLDADHRRALNLPEDDVFSWSFGLRRLLLGYALPEAVESYVDTAPISGIEGQEAVLLGGLADFIDALSHWRVRLNQPGSAADWQLRINDMLDALLAPDMDEQDEIQILRDALATLVEDTRDAEFEQDLAPAVFVDWINNTLDQNQASQRFLSGGVTFCNMVPMRSVPFQMICLLGMNVSDYPRTQEPPSFDLIAKEPRKGDRSRRDDDRYLFLEALLSARSCLYLSYIGHDQRDNSERLPSVLISELLDVIKEGFAMQDADLIQHLITEHPLQAFSPRAFEMGSYADEWLAKNDRAEAFIDGPMTAEPITTVSVDEFIRFFLHPGRAFLRQRLGLGLGFEEDQVDDQEPFSLDALEAYQLGQAWIQRRLEDNQHPSSSAFLQQAYIPSGPFGERMLGQQAHKLEGLASAIEAYEQDDTAQIEVDVFIANTGLTGWIKAVSEQGLLRYRPANLKAKDRLRLWLEHLIVCRCAPGAVQESRFLARDKQLVLPAISADEASEQLASLMRLYQEGHQTLLPFYPESAFAYAEMIRKEKPHEQALLAAMKKWEDGYNTPGEGRDKHWQLLLRGREPFEDAFGDIAYEVFGPMLRLQQELKYDA